MASGGSSGGGSGSGGGGGGGGGSGGSSGGGSSSSNSTPSTNAPAQKNNDSNDSGSPDQGGASPFTSPATKDNQASPAQRNPSDRSTGSPNTPPGKPGQGGPPSKPGQGGPPSKPSGKTPPGATPGGVPGKTPSGVPSSLPSAKPPGPGGPKPGNRMHGSPNGPAQPPGGNKKPTSPVGPGAKGGDSNKDKLKDAAAPNKTSAQRLNEARQKGAKETAKVAATEAVVKIAASSGIPPQVVRIIAVGLFGAMSLGMTFLFMLAVLGIAGSFSMDPPPPTSGNAGRPAKVVKEKVPRKYNQDFIKTARRYRIPWTLLASISQLNTDMGQVAPYPEDTVDRDPKRENLRTPGGGTATGTAGAGASVAATDGKVFVLGDSITVGTLTTLKARLQGAGWTVEADAVVGRDLATPGEGTTTGTQVLDTALAENKIGGTLIVALGTNAPGGITAASIDAVMAKVPATTRVFWPTVMYGPGSTLNPQAANDALNQAKSRHSNLVVPDWRPNPAGLDKYGHPTTLEAKTARVELLTNALGTYAPTSSTANISVSNSGLLTEVNKYLGVPYKYGGTDPATGLDCSGFVKLVFENMGVTGLPRTSRDQANHGTAVASIDQALPGDTLYFNSPVSHAAIYMGNGQMAEAPRTGLKVRITTLREKNLTHIRRFGDSSALMAPGAAPGLPAAGGNPAGLKTKTYPKIEPPIGTDVQAQGAFLIYPSAVSASGINPQDMRYRGGNNPKSAPDWVASELAKTKKKLVNDEGWKFSTDDEKVAVWTEAVRRLPVADPNEAACVATIWDTTLPEDVANAIESLWSCELNYAPTLNSLEVSAENDTAVKMDDPARKLTQEALVASWAFSQWGQIQCNPDDDSPQGVFPLTKEVFAENALGYEGKDRCDPAANIHAAVRAFISVEQKPDDAPERAIFTGTFKTMVGGWAKMPWVLGSEESRNSFLATGPIAPATPPTSCVKETAEWISSIPSPSLAKFKDKAGTDLSEDDMASLTTAFESIEAETPSPRETTCASMSDAAWYRIAATEAETSTQGLVEVSEDTDSTSPAPADTTDTTIPPGPTTAPSVASKLQGLAEFLTTAADTADNGVQAVRGEDAVVLRLSSTGKVVSDVPPLPASTSRVSYAQQVVALARAIAGIDKRDSPDRKSNPWVGEDTPFGKTVPLALRAKSEPSGAELAGAAARSVGAPAHGTQDPTGVRFVRRTFASINAPPPPNGLNVMSDAGTPVEAGDMMPGDLVFLLYNNGTARVGIIVAGGNYVYEAGDGRPAKLDPIMNPTLPEDQHGVKTTLAAAYFRRYLPPISIMQTMAPAAGGMSTGLVGFPDAKVQAAWDRWGPLFVAAGQQHNIDPLLPFAFAWKESGFSDTNIYCQAGRRPGRGDGIMQFANGTGNSYGVPDPCVPESAIPGGTQMIKGLSDKYNGDARLFAMAYNAGPAVADAAVKCGCWPVAAFNKYYSNSAKKQGITRQYSEGPDSVPAKYALLKQYAQVAAPPAGGPPGSGPAPSGNIVEAAGFKVDASIAANVTAMITEARAAGHNLGGYGWRSIETTIKLRGTNKCPDIWTAPASSCVTPTAIPGTSMHEKGLAIDFKQDGSTLRRSHSGFAWLQANAARFGFHNLPSESWHWSVNGH